MAQAKKTLVLGASDNPARYSYLAINKLASHGHPVVAIGKKLGKVGDVQIEKDHLPVTGVDTVTLYLNPMNQREYIDYILDLKPKRIIFNPGTENEQLITKAKENGIEPVIGCTLVMLSIGNY
ncbi:CoA-binding protein [Flavisolibacter tropicus]|uniref:CoA-binding protein n=1 Tax=Flavisolibacter tropicus TaxID=1492898 RepID=A0A172TTS6_9BACT|nr:CoA-binding protein [Flavisolibacter tropicus]ANE50495.1 CoA-binding protein [Flavisolibacter tropicus]